MDLENTEKILVKHEDLVALVYNNIFFEQQVRIDGQYIIIEVDDKNSIKIEKNLFIPSFKESIKILNDNESEDFALETQNKAIKAEIKNNPAIESLIGNGIISEKDLPKTDSKTIENLCEDYDRDRENGDEKATEAIALCLIYLDHIKKSERIKEMYLNGVISLRDYDKFNKGKKVPQNESRSIKDLLRRRSIKGLLRLFKERYITIDQLLENYNSEDTDILLQDEIFLRAIQTEEGKYNEKYTKRIVNKTIGGNDAEAKKGESTTDRGNREGVSVNTITKLCLKGMMQPVEILEYLTEEAAQKKVLENEKFVKKISCRDLLALAANMDWIDQKGLKKLLDRKKRDKLSANDVIDVSKSPKIDKEHYLALLLKLPPNKRPSSDKLFEFFEPFKTDNLPKENHTITFTGCDILKLVKAGFIEGKRLVDVYEAYSPFKSIDYITPAGKEEKIPDEEYLQYFTLERILPLLDDPEYVDRFKDMYFELQERQKEGQAERDENLVSSCMNNNDLSPKDKEEILIKLAKNGIVRPDSISKYISPKRLFEEKIITLDERFATGNMTRKEFYEIVDDNRTIQKHINDGNIKAPTLVTAYLNGIIGVSDVGEIFSKEELLEDFRRSFTKLKMPENGEQRQRCSRKIEKLVVTDLINYDTLENMQTQGIIGEDEFKEILSAYDIQKEINKIKETSSIANTAIPNGTGTIETGGHESRSKKGAKTERTSEYMDFINAIGENKVTVIPIITGALEGYNFILLENMQVAVLEKEKNGNATYILPLKKAIELAESKNKTNLRKEKNVKVVNHTANWGANLLGKISSIQDKTLLSNREDVTYAEGLQDRNDHIRKLIEDIETAYEEKREVNEGGHGVDGSK